MARTGTLSRTAVQVARMRLEVLAAYGGRCACCGEVNHRILTLDHVTAVGSEGRGEPMAAYRDARARNFPPDYQVLCFNCNWLKGTSERCDCQVSCETVDEALLRYPRRPHPTGRDHYLAKPIEVVRRVQEALSRGLTYRGAAKAVGVSRSTVARIAQGKHYSTTLEAA